MNRENLIERYKDMAKMESEGVPSGEIGKKYNISSARVRYILGHPISKRRYNRAKEIGNYHYSTRENYRIEVINLLGGKCVKCGYNADTRALQIDHIYGDGWEDRRKNSSSFYQTTWEAVKSGSKRYQILCANCNLIKEIERRNIWK